MFNPPVKDLFSYLLGEAALTLIKEKIAVSLPNLISQLRRMASNEQSEARLTAIELLITETGRYLPPISPSIPQLNNGPAFQVTRGTLH